MPLPPIQPTGGAHWAAQWEQQGSLRLVSVRTAILGLVVQCSPAPFNAHSRLVAWTGLLLSAVLVLLGTLDTGASAPSCVRTYPVALWECCARPAPPPVLRRRPRCAIDAADSISHAHAGSLPLVGWYDLHCLAVSHFARRQAGLYARWRPPICLANWLHQVSWARRHAAACVHPHSLNIGASKLESAWGGNGLLCTARAVSAVMPAQQA